MHTATIDLPLGAPSDRARWLLVLGLAVAFAALALFLSNGVLVDDAYIAIRYSQRLAAGQGLTFQAGPAVEGYSCFSWVVLGALLQKLGLPPAAFLPLFGVACGATAVAVATRAAQRWDNGGRGIVAGLSAGLFLACSPGLAYYAGSGLETALFVLCVLLTIVASVDGLPNRTAIFASISLLTRPEGAGVAVLALVIGVARAQPSTRRRWYRAGVGVMIIAASYVAFKWAYFGALLPNTALAKPPVLSVGLSYVAWASIDAAPLFLLTAGVLATNWRAHSRHVACLLAAVCLALMAIAEGGDWMVGNRLLLPALGLCAPTFGALVPGLRDLGRRPRWVLGALATMAAVFYLRGSVVDAGLFVMRSTRVAAYEPLRDDIARHIIDAGVRRLGTLDIGRISYAAPELELLDLGGLTDREVARLPGDYQAKRIPPQLLAARAPDAFLLSTRRIPPEKTELADSDYYYRVEADVAGSKWFREHYRLRTALRIFDDYVLCWYDRLP